MGFKDGASYDYEYNYDNSGNLLNDFNKDIVDIAYNHLNLPNTVLFGTGDQIGYIYNAVGTRVSKKVTANNVTTQSYYLGGFQYKGTVLEFFPTAEGYVDATAGSYNYVYNYKDHLGNVRVSYTKPATGPLKILEENHYYPFGMEHANYNSSTFDYILNGSSAVISTVARNKSQYKFNGQEYQDELGLNMTAMDYRQYDNTLGKFNVIDPLSELDYSGSPYGFGFNNPVYFSDPSGLTAQEPTDPPIPLKEVVVKNNYKKPVTTDNPYGLPLLPPEGIPFLFSGGDIGRGAFSIQSPTPIGLVSLGNFYPSLSSLVLSGGSNRASEGTNFGKFNAIISTGFIGLENTRGSFRLTNGAYNGNVWSPKFYGSGWRGGSMASIKTYNIGKIGKGLGIGLAITGVLVDIYGVNEYRKNPNSPSAVNPIDASANTSVAIYSLSTGPGGVIVGFFYIITDAFYPGGKWGAMKDYQTTLQDFKKATGENNTYPLMAPF